MKGNGSKSTNGAYAPPESVTFRIGGEDVRVSVLMFQDLDECKDLLQSMTSDLNWISYASKVLEVVAHQVIAYRHEDLDLVDRQALAAKLLKELRRKCTAPESENLSIGMNVLLRASGFQMPEARATLPEENHGTGTSTLSASDSPPAASSEETLSP